MYTVSLDGQRIHRRAKEKKNRMKIQIPWKEIKEMLPGALMTLFLSLAECFTLPPPFAVNLAVAYTAKNGRCIKGACIGMGMSLLFRFAWGIGMDIGQMLAFFAVVLLMRRKIEKQMQIYLNLTFALIIRALPGLMGTDVIGVFRQVGSVLLGLCVMPAFLRSVEITGKIAGDKTQDDLLCLAMPWMFLLCGAGHMMMGQMNIGVVLAAGSVMMIAWCFGPGSGAIAGIGTGFALFAGGQHVIYFIVLPFAGVISGCFHQKGRFLMGLAFLFSGFTLMYVTLQRWHGGVFVNLTIAVLASWLLPGKKAKIWMQQAVRLQWMKPRENAFLRMRIQQWVKSMQRLSMVLPAAEIPLPGKEEEAEELAEQLCLKCDQLPICWRDNYEKTKKAMEAVIDGEEMDLGSINQHFDYCERMAEIPKYLEGIYQKRWDMMQRQHLASYERRMLETHLLSISEAVQMISMEGLSIAEEEKEWMETAKEALEKMRFSGNVSFVKRMDGHLMVGIHSDILPIQPQTGERIAKQIGVYLGVEMQPVQMSASRLVLEEAPPFEVRLGKATITAANGESIREETKQNGDASIFRMLTGGRAVIALSDGMGHGKRAGNESRRTLEMLATCMEAGYSREQAMQVVNGAMMSATGGELFATVDLCLLDLWTGEAEMNKLGACSSFLMQGQKIYRLSGEALPLGILEQVTPSEKKMTMAEGDRLILMTDGVEDAYGTEEEVMRMLQRRLMPDTQEMADAILQDAIDRQNGLPEDDMTVLCVQMMARYQQRIKRRSIPA